MRQVIFNHYVNEFRTYLSFSQRVLHSVIISTEEKCSNITTQCTKETCISRKIKDMSKKNKLPAKKKFALELLHQRLGHSSTRSLLAEDTANFWEDVELRIDPDPFCTSCQISSMKNRLGLKFHSSQRHPSSDFLWI